MFPVWARKGGAINTGTYDGGYTYNKCSSSSGVFYQVDGNLGVGGISTEAGGECDVSSRAAT
jgi:hypothetical protein